MTTSGPDEPISDPVDVAAKAAVMARARRRLTLALLLAPVLVLIVGVTTGLPVVVVVVLVVADLAVGLFMIRRVNRVPLPGSTFDGRS